MTITVNVHGLHSIQAHAWRSGPTAAVEVRLRQDNGDALAMTLFVRDRGFTEAVAIAHALNGLGKPASTYDPELDGVEVPEWPDFSDAIDGLSNDYVRDNAQFGVGA